MKLGTRSQYAVMALADLALYGANAPVRISQISERQFLPLTYLEQLFVKLRKNGLVKSMRGHQGGYMLARPPHQLTILDIIQAIEEHIKTTRCSLFSERGCQGKRDKCVTHDLWAQLEINIEKYLGSVTLEDVCRPENRLTEIADTVFKPFQGVRTQTVSESA